MANPQGKSDMDLTWLGGFIDGEGSFFFARNANPTTQRGYVWRPTFKVSNTDAPTLDVVIDILRENGLPYYVDSWRRLDHPRYKPYWTVMVYGPKRMGRFCRALIPYLRTKRHEAEIVLEYCERRLAKPYEKNADGKVRPPDYDEGDLALIQALRPIDSLHRPHARGRQQVA